jgi:hypothetical protein
MIRMLLWLFGAIIAISFLRGVIGIAGKFLGDHIGSPKSPQRAAGSAASRGALKKCAVCGTFAEPSATVQRDGEKHYCSAACMEKFAAQAGA